MQIIDLSSLMNASQGLDQILKAAYIVQETRRTTDAIFFIDRSKLTPELVSEVSENLTSRGITAFITDIPLYHYIDSLQDDYEGKIELTSQDYLAISRAKEDTFVWDITTMKRYSTTEFSEQLLSFPHDRLGLFSLLTQDPYHNIVTGVDFSPSQAMTLVQSNKTLKDLITSKNAPANLKTKVVDLSNSVKSLTKSLRIQFQRIDAANYFSSIALSKDEMRDISGRRVESSDIVEQNYTTLDTPLRIANLIKKINESNEPRIFIDLSDNHVAIRVRGKNYISSVNDEMSSEQMFNTYSPLLENDTVEKVALSSKELHRVTFSYDINMTSLRSDIDMAEFTLNNLSTAKSLDDLMEKYFFEKPSLIKGLGQISHKLESIERLHEKLIPMLHSDGSYKHYISVEMPMTKTLARMEHNGVYVNSGKLFQLSQYIDELLSKEASAVRQFSPHPVNINAPKDVARLLFDTLKLPSSSRSTAEDSLLKLERETGHPIIQHIIRARQLSKLNSSFALKLPQKICPKTNRIHGTYNQNKVKTGRLSCENPNLQNIPAKSKLGRAIRKTFEAEAGRKIVAADYSQVELKILAHLANDPKLIQSFIMGRDIHQSTASIVLNKPYDEVTGEERKSAKSVNFGLIYGMTKYGLAHDLGITVNKAESFIDSYFKALPETAKYIQGLKDFASNNGYVQTLTGRKIYIANTQSDDYKKRESALRAASNAPMQGSASDLIKLAMIKIDHEIRSRQLDAKVNMQVHDEIVVDCKEEHAMAVAAVVKKCMENALTLSVPLNVDVGIGDNWENAHPIELNSDHEVPTP